MSNYKRVLIGSVLVLVLGGCHTSPPTPGSIEWWGRFCQSMTAAMKDDPIVKATFCDPQRHRYMAPLAPAVPMGPQMGIPFITHTPGGVWVDIATPDGGYTSGYVATP